MNALLDDSPRPQQLIPGLPATDRCMVMGIVNVTPGSFSDEGCSTSVTARSTTDWTSLSTMPRPPWTPYTPPAAWRVVLVSPQSHAHRIPVTAPEWR